MYICTSTSLLIFTSAHLHLCSSSHLHMYISAHLHIFTSAHNHICTSKSSHLHICTSTSSHLRISHLRILSLFFSFSLKAGVGAAGAPRNATLCGDRACRGREMQVRSRFVFGARNPLRRSCASKARNASETAFPHNPLWRSCASRARNAGEIAFWIAHASLLEEVSYETLVLETWRFTFGGSLVETLVLETWHFTFGGSLVRNARFGDLALHFWKKSRTKRLFWRLGASLVELDSGLAIL